MGDLSSELEAARAFALAGAEVALEMFKTKPEAARKSDGTWVTEADRSAERAIRGLIADTWPEHNILGEEEGLTSATGGAADPGGPTWVVDPIDGTNNYIAEVPIWATLVGLRVDGRAVVGVAHAPALGEVYDAAEGLGARLNGDAIAVDPVGRLEDSTVVYAGLRGWGPAGLGEFFNELTDRCARARGFGDFWGHMLVARGAAHVMVEASLSDWDVCALQSIVSEAGGRLTHIDGTDWDGSGTCLTSNGVLHDAVIELAGHRRDK